MYLSLTSNNKKYVFEITTNTYNYRGELELKNHKYAQYGCTEFTINKIYEIFRFKKESDKIEFLDDLEIENLIVEYSYFKSLCFNTKCENYINNENKIEKIEYKIGNTYNFSDFKLFSKFQYFNDFTIFKNYDCAKNYIFSLNYEHNIFPINGKRTFYFENGLINGENNYENGKMNGEHIIYFENGNLDSIENNVNGIWNGKKINYFENGILQSESLYDMGELIYENVYYHNGKLQEERNKDFEKVYYITGELYEHICFRTKIAKSYLKDGRLISIRHFKLVLQDYSYKKKNINDDELMEEEYDENYCPDLLATYELIFTKEDYVIPEKEKYEIIHLHSLDEVYFSSSKDYDNELDEYNKKKCEEGKFLEQIIKIKI